MKKLLLVLLSLAMLFSCDLGSDSDSKKEDEKKVTEPEVITPEMLASRSKLVDANGELLGYIIDADTSLIDLISPNGYFYRMDWDGSYSNDKVWFTGAGGKGTPISYAFEAGSIVYPKFLTICNGKYYIYKDSGDGTAKENTTITAYSSYMTTHEGVVDTAGSTSTWDNVYELVEISWADVGIPLTATTPLSISFE